MNKLGVLKHPLNLFPCRHLSLIASLFDPEYTGMILIWLSGPVGDGDNHHHAISHSHILTRHVDGGANTICGSFCNQLIQCLNLRRIEFVGSPIICNANKDPATARIRERDRFIVGSRQDLFGITENGDVRIMGCKEELRFRLQPPNELDDILKNGLIVEVILGLVNHDHVVIPLAQHE